MPNGDKAMRLDEGRILYNDLAERIKKLPDELDIPDISVKADKSNTVLTDSVSMGRRANTVVGDSSVALGINLVSSGQNSFAEGANTAATGNNSHAEGNATTASNINSHAEGNTTTASNINSHAEGSYTTASGSNSHAEGGGTTASEVNSHAEGADTTASGANSHAEGNTTIASEANSHAEGYQTTSSGANSHAEGAGTTASGTQSHTEGYTTIASGSQSHAEGTGGTFTLNNVTYESKAAGTADHTEGFQTRTAVNQPGNHAEGYQTAATGGAAHSEGNATIASGTHSHAEGSVTTASGTQSHAEGYQTTSSGTQSHAEGANSVASGPISHAEGENTTASGRASHAEGSGNTASGIDSHAEGSGNTASGNYSHVGGVGNTASGAYSNVFGRYNVVDSQENISDLEEWAPNTSYNVGDVRKLTTTSNGSTTIDKIICKIANSDSTYDASKWYSYSGEYKYVEIVGNGLADNVRSNARTLDWEGNEHITGDLYVHANQNGSGGSKVATQSDVTGLIAVQDGTPEGETATIWFPATAPQGIQVPTYSEFQALETTVGGKVSDVQINGSSVVNNGVANIPIAGTNQLGIVMTQTGYGINIAGSGNSLGRIMTDKATTAIIKAETDQYRPIVPYNQHEAVFYGLAKLAGADMNNSSNAVGTFTPEAKTGIQSMLGVPGDVQVNGTSVVTNGVANVPVAGSENYGVVKVSVGQTGVGMDSQGRIIVSKANSSQLKGGSNYLTCISPSGQHEAVFYGLSKIAGVDLANETVTAGVYPESSKAAIQSMLGVESAVSLVETVSGSTPSITAQPNVQYICGEVATISITPPANGSCDVIFTSGSTATVLTLPNTVKMPAWFDDSALEANTIYEIIITNGVYGSVMTWES